MRPGNVRSKFEDVSTRPGCGVRCVRRRKVLSIGNTPTAHAELLVCRARDGTRARVTGERCHLTTPGAFAVAAGSVLSRRNRLFVRREAALASGLHRSTTNSNPEIHMARLAGISAAILGCALLTTAGPRASEPTKPAADAQPPATAAARDVPQFSALDVNSDTMISSEEAKAHPALAAIFASCDADKNGMLNTWEFAEARSKLDH